MPFDANNVNWIELQNGTAGEYKCYINPQNSPGSDSKYPYSVVANVSLVDLWFCGRNTSQVNNSAPEICLMYTTSSRFLCNVCAARTNWSIEWIVILAKEFWLNLKFNFYRKQHRLHWLDAMRPNVALHWSAAIALAACYRRFTTQLMSSCA